MKKPLSLLLLATAFMVPSFALPSYDGFFTDTTGMFSDVKAEIEPLCRDLERRTGREFALLVVPDMEGMTIEDYSELVFTAWGVGKKGVENGLLFVLSLKDRMARIEVGYGLESFIPDAMAADMLVTYAVPSFKQDKWKEGIRHLVPAVIDRISTAHVSGGRVPSAPPSATSLEKTDTVKSFFYGPGFLFLLAVLGILFVFNLVLAGTHRFLRMYLLAGEIFLSAAAVALFIILFARGPNHGLYFALSGVGGLVLFFIQYAMSARHTCPKCREYMDIRSTVLNPPTYTSTGRRRISYHCPACTYSHQKEEIIPRMTRSSSGAWWGGSGGGFSGGSSGGGGFSFGGGSSGGGGASVSF